MEYLSSRPRLVHTITRVSLGNKLLKLISIPYLAEVHHRVRTRKYGGLLGEVAIMRIVQRVLDEISNEHLHAFWRLAAALEFISSYDSIVCLVGCIVRVREERVGIVVDPVLAFGW